MQSMETYTAAAAERAFYALSEQLAATSSVCEDRRNPTPPKKESDEFIQLFQEDKMSARVAAQTDF